MTVQQFKLVGCDKVADRCCAYMLGSKDGEYIKLSDVLALLVPISGIMGTPRIYDEAVNTNNERARLRAALGAE